MLFLFVHTCSGRNLNLRIETRCLSRLERVQLYMCSFVYIYTIQYTVQYIYTIQYIYGNQDIQCSVASAPTRHDFYAGIYIFIFGTVCAHFTVVNPIFRSEFLQYCNWVGVSSGIIEPKIQILQFHWPRGKCLYTYSV